MIFAHQIRIVLLGTMFLLIGSMSEAQSRKPAASSASPNPAALRVLDKEAERLQKEFVDNLVQLADGYEAAGDLTKAETTLGKVLELDPERKEVRERLETMKNRVFDQNEVEFDVDVTRGWMNTGLKVRQNEAVRIDAEGSYKLILNANVTADGVSTEDIDRDMTRNAGLGELIGVVFPPPKGRQKPKPGKPFAIGSENELSPEESGMLFLRLNVPAGTKSIGSVKVKISGNIER